MQPSENESPIHSLLGCRSCNKIVNRDINAAFNIAEVYYHSIFSDYAISPAFNPDAPQQKRDPDFRPPTYVPQKSRAGDPLQHLDFTNARAHNVHAFIAEIKLRRQEKLKVRLEARKSKLKPPPRPKSIEGRNESRKLKGAMKVSE